MEAIAVNRVNTEVNQIHWKQLSSLAGLYASIIIGWIAYQNYQPRLLIQFKFTDFTFFLAVSQAAILVLTPPISGRIGDRFRFKQGHRLPIISSGISFAAMVFMAVAFTLLSNPGEVLKWILPLLIVFWLVAMSIFTSPALSTVELFTPVDKLPKAMALLTIVSNLLYAVEPVIIDIIDAIGAPLTFVAGGLVTLLSGYAMRKNALDLFKLSHDKEVSVAVEKSKTAKSDYIYIFLIGTILGVATTTMFNFFPDLLSAKFVSLIPVENGKLILVGVLLLSALLSWPASILVNRFSMDSVFWLSTLLMVMSLAGVFLLDNTSVVMVSLLVFTVTFTTLSVSSLPLAIHRAGFSEKVLCVGIFFSGVALPEGIVESLQAF